MQSGEVKKAAEAVADAAVHAAGDVAIEKVASDAIVAAAAKEAAALLREDARADKEAERQDRRRRWMDPITGLAALCCGLVCLFRALGGRAG